MLLVAPQSRAIDPVFGGICGSTSTILNLFMGAGIPTITIRWHGFIPLEPKVYNSN